MKVKNSKWDVDSPEDMQELDLLGEGSYDTSLADYNDKVLERFGISMKKIVKNYDEEDSDW